jgi:DNA-binding XRE family transcriptional regulator
MPTSVKRHNLARLRQELSLTQTDLAGMIGRTQATIKAIETGKLALSENLAALIANTLGTDKQWLLNNDLSVPMPPREYVSAKLSPEEHAYDCTYVLLLELFSRLFAVARRLREGDYRKLLPIYIQNQLRVFEEAGYEPDAEQTQRAGVNTFEFFKSHPELLDPDLGRLINLDFLIKDAYQRERIGKREYFKLNRGVRELEKQFNFSLRDGVVSAQRKSALETRSRKPRKGRSRSRPSG